MCPPRHRCYDSTGKGVGGDHPGEPGERACAVIVEAVDDLERPSELRQYAVRLDEIAKKADSLFRRRMRRLFDDGNDVRSVLTGKDIYRGLKSAIDRADAVGRVLDGIALNW